MISIPFKRSDKPAFAPAVRAFVKRRYGEDPEQYAEDLRVLDKMRGEVTAPAVSQGALDALLRYYGQLVLLGRKLPFNYDNIHVSFTWFPAFNKDGKPVTSPDLNFEKANVLFNIAAMYSSLACAANHASADGLKQACVYFQHSAGVLKFLKDAVATDLRCVNTHDLLENVLDSLAALMLGQAQQCFVNKAIADSMKEAVVAKLSAQVVKHFEESMFHMGLSDFTPIWRATVEGRLLYHAAFAELRKAKECNAAGQFGDEIARLRIANDFCNKALQFQKNLGPVFTKEIAKFQETIQTALKTAEKDNDSIYLHPVPRSDAVEKVAPAAMVKPLAMPDAVALAGPPLFAALVPLAVHQIVQRYATRRDELVAERVRDYSEKGNVLAAKVASLGLPGSLEAVEAPKGVPPVILEKSVEVRNEGGAPALSAAMDRITTSSIKLGSILQETSHLLDVELKEDGDMRMRFQERWRADKSVDLQKNIRETLAKYGEKLEIAKKSDALVRAKLAHNAPLIEQISMSKDELDAFIPDTKAERGAAEDPVVKNLRQQLDINSRIAAKRQAYMDEMGTRAKTDSIAARLAELHAKGAKIDEEPLFLEELGKYQKFIKNADETVRLQEELFFKITAANEKFLQKKQNNQVLLQREEAIQALDEGYRLFKEIDGNVKEAGKFYTAFDGIAGKLLEDVKDFCYARAYDRKNFMNSVMSNIAASLPDESVAQYGGGGVYAEPMDAQSFPPPMLPGQQPLSGGGGFFPQPMAPGQQPLAGAGPKRTLGRDGSGYMYEQQGSAKHSASGPQ